ncbi:hypothetical protein ABK040_002095 [Willaertia magna]
MSSNSIDNSNVGNEDVEKQISKALTTLTEQELTLKELQKYLKEEEENIHKRKLHFETKLNEIKKIKVKQERLFTDISNNNNFPKEVKLLQKNNKIIHLNISGTIFTTTFETLTKESEFFKELLSDALEDNSNEEKAYFIDRTGFYFNIILCYLRGIPSFEARLRSLMKADLEDLVDDIIYYKINSNIYKYLPTYGIEYLKKQYNINATNNAVTFANNGMNATLFENNCKVIKTKGLSAWNCAVTVNNTKCQHYKVKIHSDQGGYIGFTSSKFYNPNGQNSGYYLDVYNKLFLSPNENNGVVPSTTTFLTVGTIVEVIYNKEAGTISYSFNGGDWIIAFKEVKEEEEIIPCIELHNVGASFELLDIYSVNTSFPMMNLLPPPPLKPTLY